MMETNRLKGALEIVERTDPGLVRGQNEDSVFADAQARPGDPRRRDGRLQRRRSRQQDGDDAAGQRAQRRLCNDRSPPGRQLDRAAVSAFAAWSEQIEDVNSAIYRAGKEERFGGMGTTLVASVFCDDQSDRRACR
jgi:serine/threonine protein phosphatase PrpC